MLDRTCPYLFIYGTLQVPGNLFADWLKLNSNLIGRGKLNGILYDLGDYPGAVYDNQSHSIIDGTIVQMNNRDVIFEKLDEYEGDEYVRKLLPVQIEDEMLTCWVYHYNLPVEGIPIIPSGNYLDYLK